MVSSDCLIDFGNMTLSPCKSEVAKAANLRESANRERSPYKVQAGCLRSARGMRALLERLLTNRAAASCYRNRGIKFHASFGSGELLADCRVVKVTDRYGECIRCVVGFGYGFQ